MIGECLAIITIISGFHLLSVYDKYRLPFRKNMVKTTVYEILDEILHFDPALPESEWSLFISEQFDKINFNETKEVISVLFQHTTVPMTIAFFALYYQTKEGRSDRLSRAKLNDFVKGSPGITDDDEYAIVGGAKLGVRGWILCADDDGSERFLKDYYEKLETLMNLDIKATLAPYYISS
jgi:hypothetical protein